MICTRDQLPTTSKRLKNDDGLQMLPDPARAKLETLDAGFCSMLRPWFRRESRNCCAVLRRMGFPLSTCLDWKIGGEVKYLDLLLWPGSTI